MDAVLSVKDVTKKIRKKTIVRNISFEVYEGEIFGFLGPNGAGKTTTIRMLVGLMKPTEGHIEIAGYDVQRNFTKAMGYIGSIVENPELYGFLTGWENLKQFARMLGDVPDERIQAVTNMVQLEERIHEKVKTYSLGMKQRLGIAQALLGKPKLLILDEPTNGLDPAGIRELRAFVRNLVEKEQISVCISSHLLSEVQMMCDRVAIMNEGEVIAVSSMGELMESTSDRVEWKVSSLEKAKALLEQYEHVTDVSIRGETVVCRLHPGAVGACNTYLIQNGITVFGVKEVAVTLEDLFLELTGGQKNE